MKLFDKMSVCQIIVTQMFADHLSIDQMFDDQVFVDQISIDHMSVGQKVFDEKTWLKKRVNKTSIIKPFCLGIKDSTLVLLALPYMYSLP
jgi:hypothetical protein